MTEQVVHYSDPVTVGGHIPNLSIAGVLLEVMEEGVTVADVGVLLVVMEEG